MTQKTEVDVQDQAAKLASKILAVMDDVKFVEKDGTNDFHKYKFASDAAILEKVRVAMIKHRLVCLPSQDSCERAADGLTTLKVTYTLIDAETGYSCQSVAYGQGQDKGDKGAYKAATGAEKYFLLKSFMIPTGDDPEADANTDRPASQKPAAQKPAASQKPAAQAPAAAKIEDDEKVQAHAQELIDSFNDAPTYPELEKRGTQYKADIEKFSKPLQDKVRAAYLAKKKKFQKLES